MNNNSIGITIIGGKGTGKTCYLYAMYSQMAFGVNGFTFMPTDYDSMLELEAGWQKIISQHTWPSGSIEHKHYEFDCSYALRPLLSFTWFDYRGSLLDEQSSQEQAQLFNMIRQSIVLLLCVPATLIPALLQKDQAAEKFIRQYAYFLADYRKKQGHQVPVVITITQSDLCSPEEITAAVKKIIEIFQTMGILKKGQKWLIMFVPVSLGENLKGKQGENITGTIAPKNIHLPILFAVYVTLDQCRAKLETLGANLEVQYGIQQGKLSREHNKGWWRRLCDGDDSSSLSEALKKIEKQLETMKENIADLRLDLEKIIQELTKEENTILIYFDGEKKKF